MARDDRDPGAYDLKTRADQLLDDAMMLSAVVHDRLQTVVELGPLPGDEAEFGHVSDRMRQVAELGETTVRSITEADFAVREILDLQSERAYQLACEFVQSHDGRAFTTADLRDVLIANGADAAAAKAHTTAMFGKWRDRMLLVAREQGTPAQWAGPSLLGRGNYALAAGKKLDLTKQFASKETAGSFKPVVRLGDPDPEIWGDQATARPPGSAQEQASAPSPDTEKPSKSLSEVELERARAVMRALGTVQDISDRLSPRRITEIINEKGWTDNPVTMRQISQAIRLLQRNGVLTPTPKRAKGLLVNFESSDTRRAAKTARGRNELIGTLAAVQTS